LAQENFLDGMTGKPIPDFSKNPDLLAIAGNSSARHNNSDIDYRMTGRRASAIQ